MYGKEGGQTRGYIHLQNSLEAIKYYIDNPNKGYEVVHQRAEEKTVREIAELIIDKIDGSIEYLDNPRAEKDSNSFRYSNETLDKSGIKLLKMEDTIGEMIDLFKEHKDRIPKEQRPKTKW